MSEWPEDKETRARLIKLIRERPDLTANQAARILGVSRQRVNQLVMRDGVNHVFAPVPSRRKPVSHYRAQARKGMGALHRSRVEAGVCYICGKQPPAPDKHMCLSCKDRMLQANRDFYARRKRIGQCPRCGGKVKGGLVHCDVCHKDNNERTSRSRNTCKCGKPCFGERCRTCYRATESKKCQDCGNPSFGRRCRPCHIARMRS